MAHDYIQIPPDSTGKKIRHTKRVDMEVTNLLIDISAVDKGQPVVGLTSGATATFIGSANELDETYIYLYDEVGTFLENEVITISGINACTVDHYTIQHTMGVHVVDANSPNYTQKIDENGSAYTRYRQGDLGFDAFGHAQFSQVTQVDNHLFTYGDYPNKYYDKIVNSGSITADIQSSTIVLETTAASGSQITRTSHQYYPYNPGEGNEIQMSIRFGDNGKAGVVRRFGLFDDNDGMFFEIDGLQRYLVIRNSSSGTVTETRVAPAEYNGETLNEPGISPFIIDNTKFNLFWIDYQWLGVGKVRFGVIAPDGTRIVAHTFENANAYITPYMKRGTLPFRLEQFNTTATASPSEMRLVCAAILRQSQIVTFPGEYLTVNSNLVAVTGSDFTPIFSAKPALTHNGLVNRTTIIPTDFEVFVDGDPIRLDVIINSALTGATYSAPLNPVSSTLVDLDATSYTGGSRINSLIFGSGVTHRELTEDLHNTLQLSADGVSQPIFTLAAKCLKPSGSANVSILVRWKESR